MRGTEGFQIGNMVLGSENPRPRLKAEIDRLTSNANQEPIRRTEHILRHGAGYTSIVAPRAVDKIFNAFIELFSIKKSRGIKRELTD